MIMRVIYSFLFFLSHHYVGPQIETKGTFSLAIILTHLKRCFFQLDNIDNLIFVSKNWCNDPKVYCNSTCNLIELIMSIVALEEEYEEYEGEFDKDEILDL